MKRRNYLFFFICLLYLYACSIQIQGQDTSFSFFRKYGKEKLLIAGCGWNKVAVVDKRTGCLDWEHLLGKGEDCNDVELTKEKNILYAYTSGARLITPSQQLVWDYEVKVREEELFTATQLNSGGYLLAICGHPARIVELDSQGNPLKEIQFETGIKRVHNQFRQIEKTRYGTYLVPLFATGNLIEIDATGKIINQVQIGGTLFSIKQLKDGKLLVACGDGHKLVEVDTNIWQVVRTISSDDIRGVSLLFVAESCVYRKGRILICNWNGHSGDKSQPKLVEIDHKNRIRWTLNDHGEVKNISAVYPLP